MLLSSGSLSRYSLSISYSIFCFITDGCGLNICKLCNTSCTRLVWSNFFLLFMILTMHASIAIDLSSWTISFLYASSITGVGSVTLLVYELKFSLTANTSLSVSIEGWCYLTISRILKFFIPILLRFLVHVSSSNFISILISWNEISFFLLNIINMHI